VTRTVEADEVDAVAVAVTLYEASEEAVVVEDAVGAGESTVLEAEAANDGVVVAAEAADEVIAAVDPEAVASAGSGRK
jgi:hypothetical protein